VRNELATEESVAVGSILIADKVWSARVVSLTRIAAWAADFQPVLLI
jgi:hypothetical protein